MTPTTHLSYFELPVADADRAQTFYGALFGWQFADSGIPNYHMIPNAAPLAGLSAGEDSHHPHVFFTVPDIAAAAAHVVSLGGQADDPVALPAGRFARCQDDQGTHFTLWQDAPTS